MCYISSVELALDGTVITVCNITHIAMHSIQEIALSYMQQCFSFITNLQYSIRSLVVIKPGVK